MQVCIPSILYGSAEYRRGEAQAHDGELDHENRRLQRSACRNVRLKWLATLRDGRLGDQRRRVPEDAGEERAATSRSRQSPQ